MSEPNAPAGEIRRGIARRALGGQALTGWWADDWKAARAAANGGWTGAGQTGERKADGVHVWFGKRYDGPSPDLDERSFEDRVRPADVVVAWAEIRDVVKRGATPELRAAYERAYAAYVEQAATPVPHPFRRDAPEGWDYFTDPENVAYWEAGDGVSRELQRAALAIIDAGCARELVQDALW